MKKSISILMLFSVANFVSASEGAMKVEKAPETIQKEPGFIERNWKAFKEHAQDQFERLFYSKQKQLFSAAKRGRAHVVDRLMKDSKGVDLYEPSNKKDKDFADKTALELAKENGHKEVLDIMEKQRKLNDSLLEAAYRGDTKSVKKLINKGAHLEAKTDMRGAHGNLGIGSQTALSLASENGHLETVKALLDKGADVHAKDLNGSTSLHHASWRAHKDVVTELLKRGAHVNEKNNDNQTPLHLATEVRPVNEEDTKQAGVRHVNVVKTLIDAGADIHAREKFQNSTPLHRASYYKHGQSVVKTLVEAGAKKK